MGNGVEEFVGVGPVSLEEGFQRLFVLFEVLVGEHLRLADRVHQLADIEFADQSIGPDPGEAAGPRNRDRHPRFHGFRRGFIDEDRHPQDLRQSLETRSQVHDRTKHRNLRLVPAPDLAGHGMPRG